MDPWQATARESAFYFLGVLADVGLLCCGGHRLPHIPHPHVDHDGTGAELARALTGSGGWWKRDQLGDGCSRFLFPDGSGWVRPSGEPLAALLANGLLWRGVLPTSFADYDEYVEDGAVLAEYPHARREMGKELVFCSIIVAGFAIGGLLTQSFQHSGDPQFGSRQHQRG